MGLDVKISSPSFHKSEEVLKTHFVSGFNAVHLPRHEIECAPQELIDRSLFCVLRAYVITFP